MPDATMRTSTSSGCGAARSRLWISNGCERAGTMAAVIFIGCSSLPYQNPVAGLVPAIHVFKCLGGRS